MRKMLTAILILLISGSSLATAHEDPTGQLIFLPIGQKSVLVNGNPTEIDVPANIIRDRTMVPVRFVSETIGATVGWDPIERRVTITLDSRVVEVWIDKTEARVDGVSQTLDVAPVIQNDRTMVPLRFVSESLGQVVGWDNSARGVYVVSGHVDSVVVIKGFTYNESNVIQVQVGKPVVVINLDSVPHTLTDNKGGFDSGSLTQGWASTFTPLQAGTFEIYCNWHPAMSATLIAK